MKGAPIKIFTGGKSALSSALKSKEERERGDKVLPLHEMARSAIQQLEGGLKKLHETRNSKSLELDTDTDSGGKASMAEILDRFLFKKNSNSTTEKTVSQLMPNQSTSSNNEFASLIRMYQTMIEKSEILSISGSKFGEI